MALFHYPSGDVDVVNAKGETVMQYFGMYAEQYAAAYAFNHGISTEKTGETLSEYVKRRQNEYHAETFADKVYLANCED